MAAASIYQQIRAEGYRDGAGQMGMLCYDDAFYKGQCSAWEEAPSRLRWFLAGLIAGLGCAVVMAAIAVGAA